MTRPAIDGSELKLSAYRQRFGHLHRAADIVSASLREAILDGEISTGRRLREEELAREFGVSRTPVREALQQLSSEGLVDTSLHQGAIVTQLTTEDILAIYVVREALEGVSARLAARRATPEHGQLLLAIVNEMETITDSGDATEFARLNLQFHAELRRAANNSHLDRFLAQIEHAVRRFGQTTFAYPGRAESTVREHRAIVEAVIQRDPERAEALAIEHMREARKLRLQMLMEDY